MKPPLLRDPKGGITMSENINEMNEINDDETLEVEAVTKSDDPRLSDEELEEIVGGGNFGFVIDIVVNTYCPYHRKYHAGVQKVRGGFQSKSGTIFPTYFCPGAKRYFFEARNGYFNPEGRILQKKR